jgi:hypothetical protein
LEKVNLTLSSGNPNQNNQAPILSSWFLRYQQDLDYGFDDVIVLLEMAIKANQIQSSAELNEVVVVGYGSKKKNLQFQIIQQSKKTNSTFLLTLTFRMIFYRIVNA